MAWLFKNFVSDRGENEIRTWLDFTDIPMRARVKFDLRIRYLQSANQLKYPYVEKWVGEEDIYEVRVVFGGVQYRSLGCYGVGRQVFTLLIGAVEKSGKLNPRDAVNTAKARMKLIADGSHTCDHFE
jgi:hypothetical protein